MKLVEIGDGVYQVDVKPLGYENLISCYILDFEKKAVVETGPKSSVHSLFDALKELGIISLDYIFISHVHLDHAGGAGTLANEFGGKIVCHGRGAKHVVNPERLWKASVEFSEINRLYEKPDPVDETRIVKIDQDSEFTLGDLSIKVMRTEGHAPHHLSFLLKEKGILFSGDSAGMCINGNVIPTTPSPFNLEEWTISVKRMIELSPEHIAYTHFGMYEADNLLERVLSMAERWAEIASKSHDPGELSKSVKESDPDLRKFMEFYSYCDVMIEWIDYGFAGMFEYVKERW